MALFSYRNFKKAVYAGGALLALLAVAAILVLPGILANREPKEPVSTPSPFEQVIVEEKTLIVHSGEESPTVDLVARLRNPNTRAGAEEYDVTFKVQNAAGDVVATETVTTYLLPGGLQYAQALNVDVPASATLDTLVVEQPDDPTFSILPEGAQPPRFSLFLRERTDRTVGERTFERQTGIVTNESAFPWRRVEVVAVALNADGEIIGTGKTFLGALKVGEQREFVIEWPKPAGTTQRVIALPTTNIFKSENFLDEFGQPERLR